MKITRLVTFTILIFLLTGCYTSTPKVPYYQELVNSWIGAPLDKKLRQSRKPSKIYYRGNKKYVVWRRVGPYLRGGVPRTELLCTYTYEVSRRGIIVAGNASGIDCPIHRPR